jgi:hypothetical protein
LAGKILFLGSGNSGHTLVYDSSEEGVGRGIGTMRSCSLPSAPASGWT